MTRQTQTSRRALSLDGPWEFAHASGTQGTAQAQRPGKVVFAAASPAGDMGRPGGRFSGLALETRKYPDSPKRPQFPSPRLNPAQIHHHAMTFCFFTA